MEERDVMPKQSFQTKISAPCETAMRESRLPQLAPILLGLTILAVPIGSFAQEKSKDFKIEEIVVYSQKRGAQSVQNVPMSISAVSGDHLEKTIATSLESLSYSFPNVTLDDIGSPIANFGIRGLATNSSIPSLDPSVGTFIDGVYLGTNAGLVTDFFDIESIEVLRGPQGVLQGKNVAGGAVLIRTRRPTQELTINSKLSINSFPGVTAASAISGGLSDNVSGKIVGYYTKSGGWADNVTTGKDQGKMETWFVRPSLLLKTDGINAYLTIEYGKTTGDAPLEKNLTYFESHPAPKHSVASNTTCCTEIRWKAATLNLNGDVNFGNGTITSVTGWRDTKTYSVTDVDSLPSSIFNLTSLAYANQFSQEVRYAGTFLDVWDVTTGVYYFQQDLSYFEARDFGPLRTTFGGDVVTKSYAAFINNNIHVTDTITFTAGIRYTREKKSAKIAPQGVPLSAETSSCNYDAQTCVFSFSGRHKTSAWTPRIALEWRPQDNILVYISRDQGLRSGGYNVRHTAPNVEPRATDDEKITSYEVGGKFSLFDRRLTVNTSAFVMDINDMLRDTVVFVEGVGFVQLNQNAGNSRVKGAEVETNLYVTPDFTINASVGYQDNSWRKIFLDITGDHVIDQKDYNLILPRLSKWTTSIGGTYTFVVDKIGEFSLWANYSYRSKAPYPDNNLTFMPAIDMVDATLSWQPKDGITVSIWGKNLLNDLVLTSNTDAGALGDIAYINPGRQYGLELRAKF